MAWVQNQLYVKRRNTLMLLDLIAQKQTVSRTQLAELTELSPASITRISAKASVGVQCRRVAAYARVSTDSEEQLTSYEAQVDHYTKYIQSREDWIFVGIYTDVDRSYGQNPKARE